MNINKLINWSYLSQQLSKNNSKTAIRANNIPNKYLNRVDNLIEFLELWEKEEEVYTKQDFDQFKSELRSKISAIL